MEASKRQEVERANAERDFLREDLRKAAEEIRRKDALNAAAGKQASFKSDCKIVSNSS